MTAPTRRAWYDARPPFLIAGAIVFLAFGIVFGVALDLATQPAPKYASLPRSAPATVELPEGPGPTILARPQGQPVRAWAPEGPAAAPPVAGAQPPLPAYAVQAALPARVPVLAIVIDDMGLDRERTLRVMRLPGPLTVSFMTYANGLRALVENARGSGHEVMAHLPMEPIDAKENPGPGALMVAMDDAGIRAVLASDLDTWTGFVGVNNHMGSRFTADRARMGVVMNELKARGLLWLDSKTTQETVGAAAARSAGVPYLERDVFLDNVENVDAITSQLQLAESLARTRGTAIAIGHPHDSTIAALTAWLPKLEGRGLALAPITEILKRRTQSKEAQSGPG